VNLKEWAEREGVAYVTARRWFAAGKVPVLARRVGGWSSSGASQQPPRRGPPPCTPACRRRTSSQTLTGRSRGWPRGLRHRDVRLTGRWPLPVRWW